MTPRPLDPRQMQVFTEKLLTIFNHGALALMLSLGHRAGLFDLLATLPPSTSKQLAQATGLQEHRVREWLGAMVTDGIVAYDPEIETYTLPPEHAAFLTRAAAPNPLTRFIQAAVGLGQEGQVDGKGK
jgi:hypothetical protein